MTEDQTHAISGLRPGTLVIVGSGIRAVGQFTLEAQAYIEWADVVFSCTADPASQYWVNQHADVVEDLLPLYENDKPRRVTYVQMAERMLQPLRRGENVVGVFYGHPGFFVNPSHRAIAIARSEGHDAFMLPAVSAADCLFADLGVDPGVEGCQIVEATDLLRRQRPLFTDGHVVILQVGMVGEMTFQYSGFANDGFTALITYLQSFYGKNYRLIHYTAALFSFMHPSITWLMLSDLVIPEAKRTVSEMSTFYIPPRNSPDSYPRLSERLGVFAKPREYDIWERKAIDSLGSYVSPRQYRKSRISSSMYSLVADLALKPGRTQGYLENPHRALQRYPDLTPQEREAVLSGSYGSIGLVMKPTGADVAEVFCRDCAQNSRLAHKFFAIVRGAVSAHSLNSSMIARALSSLGYETTVEQVGVVYEELTAGDLSLWSAAYDCYDKSHPTLRRRLRVSPSGDVELEGQRLVSTRFLDNILYWSMEDGNATSGELRFSVVGPGQPSRLLGSSADMYFGPECKRARGGLVGRVVRNACHGKNWCPRVARVLRTE